MFQFPGPAVLLKAILFALGNVPPEEFPARRILEAVATLQPPEYAGSNRWKPWQTLIGVGTEKGQVQVANSLDLREQTR